MARQASEKKQALQQRATEAHDLVARLLERMTMEEIATRSRVSLRSSSIERKPASFT
jgi:hypothetical protein